MKKTPAAMDMRSAVSIEPRVTDDMNSRRSATRRTAAAAVVVAALAAPVPVSAQERPRPDEIAAVEVYREQIATASGPRVTGGADGSGSSGASGSATSGVPLTPAASAAVRGRKNEPLERVATRPAYGAPERPLPAPSTDEREERALDAAIEAAGDTGTGRLVGLALGLLVVTVLVGGLAAARRRRADS
jgi:hypothetical protein